MWIFKQLAIKDLVLGMSIGFNKANTNQMDRVLTNSEQSKNKINKFIPAIILMIFLGGGYYLMKKGFRKKATTNKLHIVKVEKGNIRETLTATGTIVAASERIINAPVSTEIEDVMMSTGSEVKKGDLILKLDQEYTALEYERLNDELSLRKNNIEKLKLQFDKDLRDLDYQDQIKALELSELKTQVSDQERLLKIGGATAEELEAAKLKLSISEIEKKLLENDLQFKRQVNSTDKANLQLEFDIQSKRLKQLSRKLKETRVVSPQSGVITWINEDIGKTVQEGEPLVKIANLDRFEILALTSDRNNKALQVGLPVEVRLGKERLKGSITRILPEVENNTVKFYIALEKNNHESLRPNLRAEVYIISSNKENVLRAKRGTALKGPHDQFIYKVVGNEAVKTKISKGLVSSEYFEITNGLQAGDQIIISETDDFDHMDRFTIEQ